MDRFLRFEHKSQPVVPRHLVFRRIGTNPAVAVAIHSFHVDDDDDEKRDEKAVKAARW